MKADLIERRKTQFVLWRPGVTNPPPQLTIGSPSAPVSSYANFPLVQDATYPDLWSIQAAECQLTDNTVYYYGFTVTLGEPFNPPAQPFLITDPLSTSVDRGIGAPLGLPTMPGSVASGDPLSIIAYIGGNLVICDNGGAQGPQLPDWIGEPALSTLPSNDSIVIYEMPTRWAHTDDTGTTIYGDGTFQDVLALIDVDAKSPSFPGSTFLNGRAIMAELGVNTLELLPCSDQDAVLNWGYGTANYFAADYDLGKPPGQLLSTATTDLVDLINTCHQKGLRVFLDSAMSWSRNNPYCFVNYLDYFLQDPSDPEWDGRSSWGGQLPKFNFETQGYDPITGKSKSIVPVRQLFKAYLLHWLNFYHIDGLRLDNVVNFPDPYGDLKNFMNDITPFVRQVWEDRGGQDDQFLTVGEDLAIPPNIARITSGQLDGLWNDSFRAIIRPLLLGQNWSGEPNFEQCVKDAIDPRNLGFTDMSQIVNYLGSHDTGNGDGQRIYNWFVDNSVAVSEPRIKLGFACLLTAIGIPMILAGDEFADAMDPVPVGETFDYYKQLDPVNWSLLGDDWRQRIFTVVTNLIKLRTTSSALSGMDIAFIHTDFDDGKRIMAWQRGSGNNLVITVANFSDWFSPTDAGTIYQVNNWPATPAGFAWKEVTQNRLAPSAGQEPVTAWQGNVYALHTQA